MPDGFFSSTTEIDRSSPVEKTGQSMGTDRRQAKTAAVRGTKWLSASPKFMVEAAAERCGTNTVTNKPVQLPSFDSGTSLCS